MGRARPTVIGLESAAITTNTTTTMVNRYRGNTVGGEAIEAGGTVRVASGTPDIIVRDQNGVELYNDTTIATGDVEIAPVPRGVRLPLEVVSANNGGSTTVFWAVKK